MSAKGKNLKGKLLGASAVLALAAGTTAFVSNMAALDKIEFNIVVNTTGTPEREAATDTIPLPEKRLSSPEKAVHAIPDEDLPQTPLSAMLFRASAEIDLERETNLQHAEAILDEKAHIARVLNAYTDREAAELAELRRVEIKSHADAIAIDQAALAESLNAHEDRLATKARAEAAIAEAAMRLPTFDQMNDDLSRIAREMRPPEPAHIPAAEIEIITFARGDTVVELLERHSVRRADIYGMVDVLKEYRDPRHFRPGQDLAIEVNQSGDEKELVALSFNEDSANVLRIEKIDGDYSVERLAISEHIAAISQSETISDTDAAEITRTATIDAWTAEEAARLDTQFASERRLTFARGDTLSTLLSREGIPASEIYAMADLLDDHYNVRRFRAGQQVTIQLASLGDASQLLEFSFKEDPLTTLRIHRSDDGFKLDRQLPDFEVEQRTITADIRTSLSADLARAGVESDTISQAARLLAYTFDLQRNVHAGDKVELIYERHAAESGLTRGGNVLMIRYTSLNRNQVYELFRFGDGRDDYFERDGSSVRRSLLRTPVDGARLSSRFGMRRHPILGYNKMHTGVDFAAPTGTPIYAAGDGVITRLGRNGGYGHYIKIKHNNEISTAYAHLSRYARGMKPGTRVTQGEVIGYVGSTGRSTGPHLHYEVIRNGRHIDPLSIDTGTAANKLSGTQLEAFKRQVSEYDRTLIASNQS